MFQQRLDISQSPLRRRDPHVVIKRGLTDVVCCSHTSWMHARMRRKGKSLRTAADVVTNHNPWLCSRLRGRMQLR